jgi:hypothetical protein
MSLRDELRDEMAEQRFDPADVRREMLEHE